MRLPKDPFMLLSVINTALRDTYPSLEELCAAEDADPAEITKALEAGGFTYDREQNRFA